MLSSNALPYIKKINANIAIERYQKQLEHERPVEYRLFPYDVENVYEKSPICDWEM